MSKITTSVCIAENTELLNGHVITAKVLNCDVFVFFLVESFLAKE